MNWGEISTWFSDFFSEIGRDEKSMEIILKISMVILFAGLLFFVIHKWLSFLIWKFRGKRPSRWMDIFYKRRFFSKCAYLIFPIAAFVGLEMLSNWRYSDVVGRFIEVWLTFACLSILLALVNAINIIYESYPVAKNRPITMFIQVIKLFLWSIAVVVAISFLLNKSPEKLVVGLGAFAAVLMLIFKDSILGFVAGIQLIANKMVRIGDWIVMPENNANGTVLEINLYTVKVQNWDMTISMIPTYQMVSQSFINWRGMQESAGRRIERWVNIDIDTVHFLSQEEIEKLRNSDYLKDYIDQMLGVLNTINQNKETLLDERKLTNLGVFRKYMELWLSLNPDINNQMTYMVRQLQPTPTGIPLEIYCFSVKQEWKLYESVQADIFDHIFAILPLFGLKTYQYPNTILPIEKHNP